jgi:hypothetical protein
MNEFITEFQRFRLWQNRYILLFVVLAFAAGFILSGLLFVGLGSSDSGKLNKRYARQHARAAETIGRLEGELERERQLNLQLREHNIRAGELAAGLTDAVERNVRNLQDAVGLIGEIRAKLKILAEFYADSDTGDGGS